jgi:hypothetical protein
MSVARLRQIARLEKLAKPYLKGKMQIAREWSLTRQGAVGQAAVLAFLIRYGNPRFEEPLSCATERCAESVAWKDCCDEFKLSHYVKPNRNGDIPLSYRFPAHKRDSVFNMGAHLRHFVISSFPGADEKEKLDRVFSAAPPWLLWFTFADYTAALLDLTLPDLSEVSQFVRTKQGFDIWWGLPRGKFERQPWPYGMENEPLARTDLDLIRPVLERPLREMTTRELRRTQALSKRSEDLRSGMSWPHLISKDILKMSSDELPSLTRRHSDDFHHSTIGRPIPGSTIRPRS